MKLSKANLAAAGVASRDAADEEFHRLHVTAAGETVASNGRAIMVVEPVDPERAGRFPAVEREEAEPGDEGVGVALDVVASARSAMPKERKPSLGYVQLTRCSETEVELMATDGARKHKHSGPPSRCPFPKWRRVVRDAWAGENRRRVLVDGRSLMALLDAMCKACPDPVSRNAIFIEVGESDKEIVLRAFNGETNQHVVGVIRPLGAGGKWLRRSPWEAGLAGEDEARGVRRVKR